MAIRISNQLHIRTLNRQRCVESIKHHVALKSIHVDFDALSKWDISSNDHYQKDREQASQSEEAGSGTLVLLHIASLFAGSILVTLISGK